MWSVNRKGAAFIYSSSRAHATWMFLFCRVVKLSIFLFCFKTSFSPLLHRLLSTFYNKHCMLHPDLLQDQTILAKMKICNICCKSLLTFSFQNIKPPGPFNPGFVPSSLAMKGKKKDWVRYDIIVIVNDQTKSYPSKAHLVSCLPVHIFTLH